MVLGDQYSVKGQNSEHPNTGSAEPKPGHRISFLDSSYAHIRVAEDNPQQVFHLILKENEIPSGLNIR